MNFPLQHIRKYITDDILILDLKNQCFAFSDFYGCIMFNSEITGLEWTVCLASSFNTTVFVGLVESHSQTECVFIPSGK